MRITRSRKLTVRMGDYETYQFGAEISVSHNDLGLDDQTLVAREQEPGPHSVADELQRLAADELDRAISEEINDAVALTRDQKSFILRV